MPRIHIVGAGVAGLTLAGMLHDEWEIHLHEREWSVPSVPTIFALWPSAMGALDAVGCGAGVRRLDCHLETATVHDHSGHVLTRVTGQDIWLISRPALLDLLRSRLPDKVVRHDARVTSPEELEGDVVVGADGVHSLVRQTFWTDAGRPRRLGTTALRGVVDACLSPDSMHEYWGDDLLVGVTPTPDGGTNWFATVPQEHFADRAAALREVRRRAAHLPAIPRAALEAAEPAQTLVNDLWESRWPRGLVRGRVALVGDSAHAMAPNLGRGACEAIVDAVALGSALRSGPIDAALRSYARARFVSPQAIRIAARTALRIATSRRARLPRTILRRSHPEAREMASPTKAA